MTLALSVAVLIWGGWGPLAHLPERSERVSPPPLDRNTITPLPPLVAFEEVWETPMQGPPATPESVPLPAEGSSPPTAVPRPEMVLLGVYDSRIAVFRSASGNGEEIVVGVGDRVGNAIVKEIVPRGVFLLVQDTVFAYELEGP